MAKFAAGCLLTLALMGITTFTLIWWDGPAHQECPCGCQCGTGKHGKARAGFRFFCQCRGGVRCEKSCECEFKSEYERR